MFYYLAFLFLAILLNYLLCCCEMVSYTRHGCGGLHYEMFRELIILLSSEEIIGLAVRASEKPYSSLFI